jgi:hypothetical protein
MRREEIVDGVLAAALVPLALIVALPFRSEAIARTPVSSLGWDAALHAAEGLDLFDDLRLFRPLDALGLLLSRHWWGPVWALVSAPFQAAFGPSLSAASLPSLAAFVLAPSSAYLLARRLAPGGLLTAAATFLLVAILFLRSPMLLETSAWPMLESLGGFLAVAAFGFFAKRDDCRARRAAFALGAALFLMKVHYGVFALVTLGVATWLGQDREARRRLLAALRTAVRGRSAAVLASLVALLAGGRLLLDARGGDVLTHRLPSVPNVAWGALVLSIVLVVVRRMPFGEAWRAATPALRDFALWGLTPVAVWCLDPANVRGWYRQIFQPTDAPFRPLAQLAAYAGFLREEYALAALPFGLVVAGLVLALVLPGSAARRTLAVFATWPVLLMCLSRFPAEARFLGFLAPALFAAAAAGLVAFAGRLPRPAQEAALFAGVAALTAVLVSHETDWRREADVRATYRYPYDEIGRAAVAAALAAAPATGPVRIVLPAEPPVWPTVRLVLRLGRRDLAPAEVDVSQAP